MSSHINLCLVLVLVSKASRIDQNTITISNIIRHLNHWEPWQKFEVMFGCRRFYVYMIWVLLKLGFFAICYVIYDGNKTRYYLNILYIYIY